MSVLLPTLEWGSVCEQVSAGLGPEDELLVICDTDADPVASHDPPDCVEILVAGEPEGCSGKANALAYGMERANNDRFVWTDDDFDRDPQWLDRLINAGETHGPASAIPFFCGEGWWRLFEPWYGAFFTLLFYLQIGNAADIAWGGGITFTRAELTVDVPTLTAELRTVLSDDYLLSERLPSVYPVRSMVTPVVVSGSAEAVRHRIIRFVRIVGVNEGWAGSTVAIPLVAVGILYPLVTAPVLTLAFAGVYLGMGLRRPNFLFAYIGTLLLPVVIVAGLLIKTFEWGGRRYRFDNDGAVEVLKSR